MRNQNNTTERVSITTPYNRQVRSEPRIYNTKTHKWERLQPLNQIGIEMIKLELETLISKQ